MKITLLFFVLLSGCLSSFGQETSLTFFKLPALADSGYIASEAYLSCNYYAFKNVTLKNYKGTDAAVSKLALLIKHTSLNQKPAYLSLSDNTDTTTEKSFDFYSFFTSHSANPTLISKIEAGKYIIFFVSLEPGFPLMTFCLMRQEGVLLNHTAILYHPAIAAIATAVNQAYESPSEFAPLQSLPAKNSKVDFDSSFGAAQKSISFYFDLVTLNADCNNRNDTAGRSKVSFAPEYNLYCSAVAWLKAGDFGNYYPTLGEKSERSVRESLTGIAENDIEFYKNYKSSYTFLNKAIDLGPLKLVFVTDPRNEDPAASRSVYLRTYNNGIIKWVNENHEFYFDDLLRTPEFMKVIYH